LLYGPSFFIDDVSATAMLTLSMKNKGGIKYKSPKLICNFFKQILYVPCTLSFLLVANFGENQQGWFPAIYRSCSYKILFFNWFV
jgi:hypothetical protein